jgi:hypothetical protein
MASDIANMIYNIALIKERQDYEEASIKLVFVIGYIDGYEISSCVSFFVHESQIYMKHGSIVTVASIFSFYIICQKILANFLHIYSRQDNNDSFVTDYHTLRLIHVQANQEQTMCNYVFGQTMSLNNVYDFTKMYMDIELHEIRTFLSIHFYFALGSIRLIKKTLHCIKRENERNVNSKQQQHS